MVGAITAALAALAGLASKASNDAADAERQKRERAQHKQAMASAILQNRAAMGGADTARSALASADNDFERQLLAGRRDTSGDFLPFVNALSGVAQGIASDVARAPAKPSAPVVTSQPGALKPVFDSYGNGKDERSFLMRLAQSGKL